ncbi:MAG: integrase core domain-containing protein, partial [Pseudonocardiaceae bacterium]
YDNALAESVNGLYKTELINRQGPWRTRDDVELATFEWVDWYNPGASTAPAKTCHRSSTKPSSI